MTSFYVDSYLLRKLLSYANEKTLLSLLFIKPFNQITQQQINLIRPTDRLDRNMFIKERMIKIMKSFEKPENLTILNDGLFYSCIYVQYYLVEIILSKNYPLNWDRGLMGACYSGDRRLVNLMISKGARDWNLGLEGACHGGNREIVELMISKGATNLNSGLINACYKNNLDICELLIQHGANDFIFAKQIACMNRHHDLEKLISKYISSE